MKIIRDGKEYILTAEELEQAYRERQHNYLLDDAAEQLDELVRIEFGDADFAEVMGFTVDDACDENSEHYLLEEIVAANQNTGDCNRAENDIWKDAVKEVLLAVPGAAKLSYVAEYDLYVKRTVGRTTRGWCYLTTLYPEGYESAEALDNDATAYLGAAFARHAVCNGDVKIIKTVYKRKRIGPISECVGFGHPNTLCGTIANGSLILDASKEV